VSWRRASALREEFGLFEGSRSGPVLCRSCGRLVDREDRRCPHCNALWPSLWGYSRLLRRLQGQEGGLERLIIGGCAALYVLSLLLDPSGIGMGGFMDILAPSTTSVYRLGAAGIIPVWGDGRWWTILSAGWLHGSLLHILFNMYWVWLLVPQVVGIFGVGRTVIIYTISSAAGFLLSSCAIVLLNLLNPGLARLVGDVLGRAGFTLGASAALMGLLGAMIAYSRHGGPREYAGWAGRYVILFLVIGLLMRSVDNWAHLGGLAGGYLSARAMNPRRRERFDHLLAAAGCLLATVLAVIVSLITT
jgi:rhomboid protease GluP